MANAKMMDQVILGLLSHEPMTGYDIKRKMDTGLKLFWNASFGSIYPTLNLLEQEGKVIKTEDGDDKRNKIFYTITDKGRDSLKEWLRTPVIKDELRYETLLKLFFGNEVGPDLTVEHIKAFEEKTRQELAFSKMSVESLKDHPEEEAHKYYMMTAIFGVKVYQVYLDWCAEVQAILEQQEEK